MPFLTRRELGRAALAAAEPLRVEVDRLAPAGRVLGARMVLGQPMIAAKGAAAPPALAGHQGGASAAAVEHAPGLGLGWQGRHGEEVGFA